MGKLASSEGGGGKEGEGRERERAREGGKERGKVSREG